MYDYIIIGGGLSGLYCGTLLAKKRKKVIVLEQHLTVGGLAAGFSRKGYYFDSCMARFVSDNNKGYLDELGLLEKENFCPHTAALNIEGKHYTPKSVEEFFNACVDAFPDQKEGLAAFYEKHVKDIARFMEINAVRSPLSYSGSRQIGKFVQLTGDMIRKGCLKGPSLLMKSFDIRLHDLLPKYIDNRSKLYNLLTGGEYYDLYFKGGNTSLMTFVGAVCSTYSLNRYPYRGFQSMCDDIADIFTSNGGELITKAKVTKILVDGGKAVGVEYVKSGITEHLSGGSVINAADLRKAYCNLLDREFSDAETLGKIEKQEATSPIPIIYLGLRIDRDRLRERFGGAHEVNFYPDLDGNYKYNEEKSFYNYAPMVIHSSCLTNPSHAPEGCCNVQIYLACPPTGWMSDWGIENGRSTGRYGEIKSMVISKVLENLKTIIPEVSNGGLIEICELGTPFTIERYTGNSSGSHCGYTWDKTLNKVTPQMGRFFYKHENVRNLYFVGHWTGYMGGVTNAFWSARHLAKVLK